MSLLNFLVSSYLLTLFLNSSEGNDAKCNIFSSVDCWWMHKKPRRFSLAGVQSDALLLSFFIDQQLHRWCFVIHLPVCQWGTASSHWRCGRLSCTYIAALIPKSGSQQFKHYILSVQLHTSFRPELCLPSWTPLFTNLWRQHCVISVAVI